MSTRFFPNFARIDRVWVRRIRAIRIRSRCYASYMRCVYMKRLDEAFGENEKLEDAVLWQRTCGTRLDIRWKRRNAAKLLLLFQRSSQSHTLHRRRVFSFFSSLRVEIKHLFFTGFSFLINRYMAMDLAGFSIPHAHTKNTCIWNAQ